MQLSTRASLGRVKMVENAYIRVAITSASVQLIISAEIARYTLDENEENT